VIVRLTKDVIRGIIKQKAVVVASPAPGAASLIAEREYQSVVVSGS
jgi:hypothetical protein